MESVGARLGDGVHDGATEFSVLGVKGIRNQPKFGDRVEVWNDGSSQVSPFTHIATVHQKSVSGFALAVDRDVARGQSTRHLPVLLNRSRCGRRYTGLQTKEIDIASAIQRESEQLLRLNYLPE